MGLELPIKRKSDWSFDTSASAGGGAGILSVEVGLVRFTAPSTKTPYTVYYATVGAGFSEGIKLPKIGKVNIKGVTGGGATPDFPSKGALYLTGSFAGEELSEADFTGPCAFVEVGGAMGVGGAGYAMLLGMNPLWGPLVAIPGMQLVAIGGMISSAKAALLMWGVTLGIQAGGGATLFMGQAASTTAALGIDFPKELRRPAGPVRLSR